MRGARAENVLNKVFGIGVSCFLERGNDHEKKIKCVASCRCDVYNKCV